MTPAQMLAQGIAELGVPVAGATQRKLLDYLELIGKWNRIHNLTAVRDPHKMVSAHLLDCLAILPHLAARNVLDVGSGAGLPGMVLALAWPHAQVSLLDSNQKKASFLRQAVIELGVPNAHVVGERVDTWRAPSGFELVIARAFSALPDFLRLAGQHGTAQATFAAMKGAYPDAEIRQLPAGFKLRQAVRLNVPELSAERHLILVNRAG